MAAHTTTWTTNNGRSLWNDRSLPDWVPALTNDLVGAIDPTQVWLFGSVARGNDNPGSDIAGPGSVPPWLRVT